MMATRVRKQIYVDRDQEARLKRLARDTGQPEAALIRQAIDRHLIEPIAVPRNLAAWSAERAFLARLVAEPAPTTPRTWRRDELHER